MSLKKQISMELVKAAPTLTKLYVPVVLFLGAILLLSLLRGRPLSYYVLDAALVRGSTPLAGIVSNLGLLIWCSCACICIFCATKIKNKKPEFYFLISAALLTTILLLDDMTMLHTTLPFLVSSLSKISFYVLYAGILIIHVYYFRNTIANTDFIYLIIACVFFTASIIADQIWISGLRGHNIVEDGCKFFGIVTWAYYHIRVCSRFIDGEFGRRAQQ